MDILRARELLRRRVRWLLPAGPPKLAAGGRGRPHMSGSGAVSPSGPARRFSFGPMVRRGGLAVSAVSGESDQVTAADAAACEHRGVHADAHRIVPGGRPEDSRVFGQVPLRQGDHDAAGAGSGDGKADGAADRHGVPDPVVLSEALVVRPGRHDDVGAEAPGLEAAHDGELPVPQQAPAGNLAGVQLLAHHGLDRIPSFPG